MVAVIITHHVNMAVADQFLDFWMGLKLIIHPFNKFFSRPNVLIGSVWLNFRKVATAGNNVIDHGLGLL
jgi:hypothetical protein